MRRFRRYGDLRDFHQELARGRLVRRYQRSLSAVPVQQIVGSVGKAGSMDRRFRYKSGKVDARLRHLREANRWGMVAFPPVELYQLNDDYYVVDGHHRVAIALENRQPEIDAYVLAHQVEFPAGSSDPQLPAATHLPEPAARASGGGPVRRHAWWAGLKQRRLWAGMRSLKGQSSLPGDDHHAGCFQHS